MSDEIKVTKDRYWGAHSGRVIGNYAVGYRLRCRSYNNAGSDLYEAVDRRDGKQVLVYASFCHGERVVPNRFTLDDERLCPQVMLGCYNAARTLDGKIYRTNPAAPKHYQMRGIRAVGELDTRSNGRRSWRHFKRVTEALYRHLGERPANHHLDRIDKYGDYELGNVRWWPDELMRWDREY